MLRTDDERQFSLGSRAGRELDLRAGGALSMTLRDLVVQLQGWPGRTPRGRSDTVDVPARTGASERLAGGRARGRCAERPPQAPPGHTARTGRRSGCPGLPEPDGQESPAQPSGGGGSTGSPASWSTAKIIETVTTRQWTRVASEVVRALRDGREADVASLEAKSRASLSKVFEERAAATPLRARALPVHLGSTHRDPPGRRISRGRAP